MNNTKHNKFFILALGALLTLTPCMQASNFGDTISMIRYHMKDILSSDGGPANKYASLLFNTRTLAYLAIGGGFVAVISPFAYAGYKIYQYRTNSPAAIARLALRNAKDTQKNIDKINAAIARHQAELDKPGMAETERQTVRRAIALLRKETIKLMATPDQIPPRRPIAAPEVIPAADAAPAPHRAERRHSLSAIPDFRVRIRA